MTAASTTGTLTDLVRSRAESFAGNGFTWLDNGEGPETRLTYADLAKRVQNIGAGLARHAKKGDRILFAKWGGTEVKVDGQEYLIMKESDILAIVDAA